MIRAEWTNDDALTTEKTTKANDSNTLNALNCVGHTADVIERKHGKWIQNRTYSIEGNVAVVAEAHCSECRLYSAQVTENGIVNYNYCPRCGAYMG